MYNWCIVRIFGFFFLPFLLETGANGIIEPKYVNMFGGEMINITSSKINGDGKFVCEFGIKSVKALKEGKQLRCLVPRLTAKGIIDLTIKKNSKKIFNSTVHVGLYGRSEAKKQLNLSAGWVKTNVDDLSIKWDPDQLSKNPSATVDIVLVGYREKSEPTFKNLKQLASGYNNKMGSFNFNPNDYLCTGTDCNLFEIGMVEVRLRDMKNAYKYGYLTSYIKPLGWFFNKAMITKYGEDWSSKKCDEWYESDKEETLWSKELLDCPCTLQQALADFGRWQPDMSCNMFAGSVCKYHQGAKHCVRSFHPTKSGAGNQCCYSENGIVRYAADSYNGSTPDRSHDWGGPVYNKAGYVPSLSHWVLDVVSLFYCCMWDNYKNCDKYMELRATRDCKNYEPPRSAAISDSSDIFPFDGTKETRLEKPGDHWLIKTSDLKMQGSFNTLICGIALKEMSSSTVEIYYDSGALQVLVDGEIEPMNTTDSQWLDLKGLTLINNKKNNYTDENITVIMQSGVGVQVGVFNQRMRILVAIPQNMSKALEKGLLKDGKPDEVGFGPDNQREDSLLSKPCNSLKDKEQYDGNYAEWVRHIQTVQTKVESCGLLDVPRSEKNNYNYSLGSEITITGCRKGTLSGGKTYKCQKVAGVNKWVPDVTAKCKESNDEKTTNKANTIRLSGIVTLVTVLLLVRQAVM